MIEIKKFLLAKKVRILGIASLCLLMLIIFLGKIVIINPTNSITSGLYMRKPFKSYNYNSIMNFEVEKKYCNFTKCEKKGKTYFIKYIKGKPGDKIKISNSKLYINDKFEGKVYEIKGLNDNFKEVTYVLKKDEYFMKGSSEYSFDSRYYGPIKKERLKGEYFLLMSREQVSKIFKWKEK